MGKGQPADRTDPQPIGDGAAGLLGRPADDLACRQRIACVRRRIGLHPNHARTRSQRLDGSRHARNQASAADGHDDARHLRQVVGDLQACGPLPGDDVRVVEGRDHRVAVLGRKPFGHHPPLIRARAAVDDLGSVALHAGYLHPGRVGGHDDHGLHPEQSRGTGDGLGMVSGRVGDDACAPLGIA